MCFGFLFFLQIDVKFEGKRCDQLRFFLFLLLNEHTFNIFDILFAPGISGAAIVLEEIESQIGRVKEEALTRIEILEKVEKWLAACDEQCWLEEYERVMKADILSTPLIYKPFPYYHFLVVG